MGFRRDSVAARVVPGKKLKKTRELCQEAAAYPISLKRRAASRATPFSSRTLLEFWGSLVKSCG